MELQFQKQEVPCLAEKLNQVQHLEQTQELRIPEGMPGVQRILGVWGQILMRSKQWQGDTVQFSGGILVWVLYQPEDGSAARHLEGWIPFHMAWELEDGDREGKLRFLPLLRSLDARSVSAGKILIRAGIAVLAQGMSADNLVVFQPGEIPSDVELLQNSWPIKLPREMGEKVFELEEEMTLPSSAPRPETLISCRMMPEITDRKVLGNKLVFRGNGNLHVLYRSEEGQLHGWDFAMPFSQYTELEDTYSADAQGDILPVVTQLDTELDGEGRFHVKAGLTGQYLVDDRMMLALTEDAYSPRREVQSRREALGLPVELDSRRENLYGEAMLPVQADLVVDTAFLPDFPRQKREGDTFVLEQPAHVQLLYYGPDGMLQSAVGKWEGRTSVKADSSARIRGIPVGMPEPQVIPGPDSISLRAEVPVQMTARSGQGMDMVTGLSLGDAQQPDPGRPSLILRRAEEGGLWALARESGSTVAAIRQANRLTEEPEPGRMLLIPVV